MINIGIIGLGYWGPNLLRVFLQHPHFNVSAVSDLNNHRLTEVKKQHAEIEVYSNYKDLVKKTDIDVVAVATPVSTHYEIAKYALLERKHVFIKGSI